MTSKYHDLFVTVFPIAASLALGCGGSSDLDDQVVDVEDQLKPRVEHVELTRLELTGADAPSMLHPVKVEVELDAKGDAFDTDVLIGLTADDGELGCVLGALQAHQVEAGASHLSLGKEFFVNAECREMVERDDVELFAAFDPWGDTEYEREGTASDQPTGLYDVVRASMLGTDDCAGCSTQTVLRHSPGLDAQLREVGLGSSVATLSLPASEDQVEMPAVDAPHFDVSTAVRVTGLAKGEVPAEGEASMSYRIRPLAGAPGTEGLGGRALDWAPLLERRRDAAGELSYQDQVALETRGQVGLQRASAIYIGDDVAARMGFGDWQGVEEFELETCVNATFEQAVYEGEVAPRANDCAVLPVIVLREHVDANGVRGNEGQETLAGGAGVRDADVWSTSWSTSVGPGSSGISFETWLDINASEDPSSTTYGGRPVNGPGSWFEAGAFSEATVFDNSATLLDAYVTLIGYDGGGAGVSMKVEAMGQSIVDAINIDSNDGITLTLKQILSAANLSTTTTWSEKLTLYGYSFDDGCATVEAGIFLEGEIGIDNEETSVTVQTAADGVTVTGVITPMAGVTAISKAEAAYSGFLDIGTELSINLEILTITMPFTVTAAVTYGSPSFLTLNELAELGLSSLSGSITFSFDYEFWCPNPFSGFSCTGDHSHTLAQWDGISDTWTLFDLTQVIQFGEGAQDFCELYDGDSVGLRTNQGNYVRAGASGEGYTVNQQTYQGTNEHFTVECQSDGTVAFKSVYNRYMRAYGAGNNYDIGQQTFVGTQERFTPFLQTDGTWALRTHHNMYLRGKPDLTMTQQTFIGTQERFVVEN